VDREQEGVGLWLAMTRLEERRGDVVPKVWTIQPPVCLLRWDCIITAQRVDEVTGDTKVTGCQASTD
jgi:hypothetical protein